MGGTESGCAAAVQAARMGVKKIVLVNGIQWLGGQFSAEALGAIDENRGHGYNGTVPIPRSGIFRDVIDAIETKNAELYGGVRRPGNTRVITTGRPVVSEQVFRELLAPFEESGQIHRYSDFIVESVLTDVNCVHGVVFRSTTGKPNLTVRAKITIDASDWGDVIQKSGAGWDVGLDARSEYDEPSAPESAEPSTDVNPITWCLIVEEQKEDSLIPQPEGYDERYFTGQWGWIDEKFAYTTRRLVDGHGFAEIDHPDVLLINTPPIDYPLDVFPADVAMALEETEQGASQKPLAAMTPTQRAIVYADAQNHSLKFLYYLQQKFPKFRKMALSPEFGTTNQLPPKPYIRESIRLKAEHVIREQEVLGFEARSNYATTMFPDAVFSWQFELDFHPTKRSWRTDQLDKGPWEATFRGNRRFGREGTGRAVFPLRSLVPSDVDGLLGAQKNLGYTSIVSSSCRLHDQSIHAGQASGAVAAVSLRHDVSPSKLPLQRAYLAEIWDGLLHGRDGAPLVIWPFADVDPLEPGFAAIQHLALRRLLELEAADTSFQADGPVTDSWYGRIVSNAAQQGYEISALHDMPVPRTRREAAQQIWSILVKQSTPNWKRLDPTDADADGIPDEKDPLPFTPGWKSWKDDPTRDGIPEHEGEFADGTIAINFTTADGPDVPGYQQDIGRLFQPRLGYGWRQDLTKNIRERDIHDKPLASSFVFTRTEDVWECELPNGHYRLTVCLGDAGHEQLGQYLKVEGKVLAENLDTQSGRFAELVTNVTIGDGRLTLTLGTPKGGSNTCINWLVVEPIPR
ncbi:FAD-dependent oxidoreductase [Bremerella volcania]|uniref:FAD-dependent oxidoreductase n=1 Tax=Bremerella volcania TaxID=2527984 RepID=UPI0018C8B9B2|nr:FAD-dependent oxidoreductase [Bremerella volcania]